MKAFRKGLVLNYLLFIMAVALMLGATSQRAEAQSSYVQPCLDSVNSAPASSYCSDLAYVRVATAEEATVYSTTIGHCVASGDCSITADVGTVATTWTVTASYLAGTPADMANMDICFAVAAAPASAVYTPTLKLGCSTGEVTASVATTNGLSDPSGG